MAIWRPHSYASPRWVHAPFQHGTVGHVPCAPPRWFVAPIISMFCRQAPECQSIQRDVGSTYWPKHPMQAARNPKRSGPLCTLRGLAWLWKSYLRLETWMIWTLTCLHIRRYHESILQAHDGRCQSGSQPQLDVEPLVDHTSYQR